MKKISITLVTVLMMTSAMSQDFFHKLGLGFSYVTYEYSYTTSTTNSGGSIGDGGGHIIYQAGLNFEIGDFLNLAPTAYPSLGASFVSTNVGPVQTTTGAPATSARSITMFAELPVLAELYIGDREGFGGFVGGGFKYSYFTNVGSIIGPQLSGGLHFNIEGNNLFTRSIAQLLGEGGVTLRGAYTFPVNEPSKVDGAVYTQNEYTNNFSFSILWDLGRR